MPAEMHFALSWNIAFAEGGREKEKRESHEKTEPTKGNGGSEPVKAMIGMLQPIFRSRRVAKTGRKRKDSELRGARKGVSGRTFDTVKDGHHDVGQNDVEGLLVGHRLLD
jgi:hypothetical protein